MTRSDCINASVLNGSAKGCTTWLERRCSQWKRQFGRGRRRSREQGAARWGLVVESRGQRTEDRDQLRWSGAVRTSVRLLGQNIGNTMSAIGYTFSVSSAVLFRRISAGIKF